VIKGGVTSDPKSNTGGMMFWLLIVVAAAFYVAGFVHLRADFPNYSVWSDWSKMTDEGWYGSAAIQHFVMGRWFLPGSFNPAVAMPVWPVMLGGVFSVTGVSMIAARALTVVLYGLSLVLLYFVVRRNASSRIAALAVLLTAVNPFCYAFDRLAVLEPVTVFWMMLGLWMAGKTGPRDFGRQVLLGVVLCLLILTKPTGVALVPAVLYLMWAGWGWPRSPAKVWPVVLVGVVAMALWVGYYAMVVKPHYLADYKLLFSVNNYRVHLSIVPQMAWVTLRDGMWIDPVLFPLAVVVVVLSGVWLRELWSRPAFGAAVIAAVAQMAYIGYHTNFQPRYYLVAAMPLAVVIALGTAAIWERRVVWLKVAIALCLVGAVGMMAATTWEFATEPEYSFLNAAQGIAAIVHGQGGEHPLLLSDSGADITLFTGIPAIDEGYTTEGLDALLARYQPGWYAAWPGWEDAEIAKVGQRYRLQEVARYQVFDDPRRQVLVLYKLSPLKP
jgi:4-amino-4-deoxy-L-arabinose transferase-like glycosyltransferase